LDVAALWFLICPRAAAAPVVKERDYQTDTFYVTCLGTFLQGVEVVLIMLLHIYKRRRY